MLNLTHAALSTLCRVGQACHLRRASHSSTACAWWRSLDPTYRTLSPLSFLTITILDHDGSLMRPFRTPPSMVLAMMLNCQSRQVVDWSPAAVETSVAASIVHVCTMEVQVVVDFLLHTRPSFLVAPLASLFPSRKPSWLKISTASAPYGALCYLCSTVSSWLLARIRP